MQYFTSLRIKSLTLVGFLLLVSVFNSVLPVFARSPAPRVGGPDKGPDTIGAGPSHARNPAPVVTDSGNGSGAGTHRGSEACPLVKPVLTALVPTYRIAGKLTKEEETLEERPTVWIYVPYDLEKVSGELQLWQPDEAGRMTFQKAATVTGTAAGMVGVRLPTTTQLRENERLRWRFIIICDPKDPNANPSTQAVLVRRAKDSALAKRVQSATPAQLVDLYTKEGLWYDVLNRLAELRQPKPKDPSLVQHWKALLGKGGLSVFDSKELDRKTP
jgi:Domain of Unknown Function (DUF928)